MSCVSNPLATVCKMTARQVGCVGGATHRSMRHCRYWRLISMQGPTSPSLSSMHFKYCCASCAQACGWCGEEGEKGRGDGRLELGLGVERLAMVSDSTLGFMLCSTGQQGVPHLSGVVWGAAEAITSRHAAHASCGVTSHVNSNSQLSTTAYWRAKLQGNAGLACLHSAKWSIGKTPFSGVLVPAPLGPPNARDMPGPARTLRVDGMRHWHCIQFVLHRFPVRSIDAQSQQPT